VNTTKDHHENAFNDEPQDLQSLASNANAKAGLAPQKKLNYRDANQTSTE